MTSIVDKAINAIQNLALEIQPVNIKMAPDHPIESALILPIAITYIVSGTGQADNASTARLLLDIRTDIYLDYTNLSMAYRQVNGIIPDFLRRLAGDPTLDATVETINFPVSVTVGASQFNTLPVIMISFTIPLKFMETPIT